MDMKRSSTLKTETQSITVESIPDEHGILQTMNIREEHMGESDMVSLDHNQVLFLLKEIVGNL